MLTKEEKWAISILDEKTVLKDGHHKIGLLWKEGNLSWPYNKQLAVQQQPRKKIRTKFSIAWDL